MLGKDANSASYVLPCGAFIASPDTFGVLLRLSTFDGHYSDRPWVIALVDHVILVAVSMLQGCTPLYSLVNT